MTPQKIYGPWIKWHGGECPVLLDQEVMVKLRNGVVRGPRSADTFRWDHADNFDIVEYCVAVDQADLKAAEKLLRVNGYTVTPPAKPLTFDDVAPMTEVPDYGDGYWVVHPFHSTGVASATWRDGTCDLSALQHRMAYLDKEHALIAARHIFGLKGGEL